MTMLELVEAVDELGAHDIVVSAKPFDCGHKLGVALSFRKGGSIHRNAVGLPSDADPEEAYPALLDWATKKAA